MLSAAAAARHQRTRSMRSSEQPTSTSTRNTAPKTMPDGKGGVTSDTSMPPHLAHSHSSHWRSTLSQPPHGYHSNAPAALQSQYSTPTSNDQWYTHQAPTQARVSPQLPSALNPRPGPIQSGRTEPRKGDTLIFVSDGFSHQELNQLQDKLKKYFGGGTYSLISTVEYHDTILPILSGRDNNKGVKVVLLTHATSHTKDSMGPLWLKETHDLANSPVLDSDLYTLAPQNVVKFNRGFFASTDIANFETTDTRNKKTPYILTSHKPLSDPVHDGIYLLTQTGYNHSLPPLIVDIMRSGNFVNPQSWFSVNHSRYDQGVQAVTARGGKVYVFIDTEGDSDDKVKSTITRLLSAAKEKGNTEQLYLALLVQAPSDKMPLNNKQGIIDLVQRYTKDHIEQVKLNSPIRLDPAKYEGVTALGASETLFVLTTHTHTKQESAIRKDATLKSSFGDFEVGYLTNENTDDKLNTLVRMQASAILLDLPHHLTTIGIKQRIYHFFSERSMHVTRILVSKRDVDSAIGAVPLTNFYVLDDKDHKEDDDAKKISAAGYHTLKKRTEERDMHRIYILGGSALKTENDAKNDIMRALDSGIPDRKRRMVHIREASLVNKSWEDSLKGYLASMNSGSTPVTLVALDTANQDTTNLALAAVSAIAEAKERGVSAVPSIVLFNSDGPRSSHKDVKGIRLYALYTLDDLAHALGSVTALGPVGGGAVDDAAMKAAMRVVADAASSVLPAALRDPNHEMAEMAEAASAAIVDMITRSAASDTTSLALVARRNPGETVCRASAELIRQAQSRTGTLSELARAFCLGVITGTIPVGSIQFNLAAIAAFSMHGASSRDTNPKSLVRGSRGTALSDLVNIARSFITETGPYVRSNRPVVGFCGEITEKDEIIRSLGIRDGNVDVKTINISNAKQTTKPEGPRYDHVAIGATCSGAITDLAAVYLIVCCKLAWNTVSVIVPGHLYRNIQKQVCETLSLEENCGILKWIHIGNRTDERRIMITMELDNARKILATPKALSATPPNIIAIGDGSMVVQQGPQAQTEVAVSKLGVVAEPTPQNKQRKPFVFVLCDQGTKETAINSALQKHSLRSEDGYTTAIRHNYGSVPIIVSGDVTLLVLKNDSDLKTHTRPLFFKRVVFDVQEADGNEPEQEASWFTGVINSAKARLTGQNTEGKKADFYGELHGRMLVNEMYKRSKGPGKSAYFDLQTLVVFKIPASNCNVPKNTDISEILKGIPGITLPTGEVFFEKNLNTELASCHLALVKCGSIASLTTVIQTISKLNELYRPERIVAWVQTAEDIGSDIGTYTKETNIQLPSDKRGQSCWLFRLHKGSGSKFGAFV